MDKQSEQSEERGGFLPIILSLAGFFLFLGVVAYFWLDRQPETMAFGGASPEERAQMLREYQEAESQRLENYGWVDQDQEIVRLPVERGIELFLEELNQEQQAQN